MVNHSTTDATASLISPPVSTSLLQPGEPVRLGILASGSGTNFEAVARAIASGLLKRSLGSLVLGS